MIHPVSTRTGVRRSLKIFSLFTMMFLPQLTTAGTLVDILTPVNVTISTRNLNDASIVCGVPIASCNAGSPIPLINVTIGSGTLPPFSATDVIFNVQDVFASGGSGYITFFGLDASALDHVIVGLRNGFVNVGDPWPFATPESAIAADLLSGNAAATANLKSFFLGNLTAFPQILGSGGTLYEFSGASIVGTVGPTTITPEPTGKVLTPFVLLAAILFSYRRARALNQAEKSPS